MAQDLAEIPEEELCRCIRTFLEEDFSNDDAELRKYKDMLPKPKPALPVVDSSANEVIGWTALFANHNYDLAADRFEECWTDAKLATSWKSALSGNGIGRRLSTSNPYWAIPQHVKRHLNLPKKRSGVAISSWFNRLRASVNRARAGTKARNQPPP